MVLFAACVAVVFAALMREGVVDQVLLGARIFGGLVGGALIVGWVMYALAP
jgi:hypothetical protein